MKLGIISDIHSNLPALEVVLEELRKENVEMLLCLGDVVGYGPFPDQTVQTIRDSDLEKICVKGNHDEKVLGGKTMNFNPAALEAAEWTKENIAEESLEFLRKLDEYETFEADGKSFFLTHGSPRDPLNEYVGEITRETILDQFFEDTGADVILVGHTHVPFKRKTKRGLMVNPGSVGQPRDGDKRASYAIINAETTEVKHGRVPYNIDKVAEEIKQTDLPDSLAERLYRGN